MVNRIENSNVSNKSLIPISAVGGAMVGAAAAIKFLPEESKNKLKTDKFYSMDELKALKDSIDMHEARYLFAVGEIPEGLYNLANSINKGIHKTIGDLSRLNEVEDNFKFVTQSENKEFIPNYDNSAVLNLKKKADKSLLDLRKSLLGVSDFLQNELAKTNILNKKKWLSVLTAKESYISQNVNDIVTGPLLKGTALGAIVGASVGILINRFSAKNK